jgi:hypothetical protein
MKTYWGSGDIVPRILNLGTKWNCMVSFMPVRFTTGDRAPVTHWIGGWVGPRAGLDAVDNRKIPFPSNPDRLIP